MSDPTKQNRDINSLQPVARKAAQLFLDECKKQGVDIFVTEYHRSQERQNWLYEQGRTRPGKVVTWTKNSNHTSGYAWDIACSPPHQLYDNFIIAKAGIVAKELGIEWGGDWKEKDTPHFQVSSSWKAPEVKKDEQLDKAVKNLVLEGVIGSPAAWFPESKINLKNVESLIIKVGIRLFDTSTYVQAVDKMVEHKIISNSEIWIKKTYTQKNVRDLIVKVSGYIG